MKDFSKNVFQGCKESGEGLASILRCRWAALPLWRHLLDPAAWAPPTGPRVCAMLLGS